MSKPQRIEAYPEGEGNHFSSPRGDVKYVINRLRRLYREHVTNGPYEDLNLWSSDYSDGAVWHLTGHRLETPEEVKERDAKEAERNKKREEEEKAELERLSKKYKVKS